MNRLLLIDGSYYAYRSFFAHANLCNSRGEPTGAIYGVVKSVARMLRDVNPTHAVIVWDSGYAKKRVAIQADYKAGRASMPEELRAQMVFLKTRLPEMGIKTVSLPDTEADDLIASYALWNFWCMDLGKDRQTIIATADKDMLQCVNGSTFIYSTAKADIGDRYFALLGVEEVRAKWGVNPEQIGDMLALMGDDGDNIKGVEGIGPKTAAKIINEQKTMKRLMETIELGYAVTTGKNNAAIVSAKTRILENLEMVRLETDLPLPIPIEELTIGERTEAFREAMRACEINEENL